MASTIVVPSRDRIGDYPPALADALISELTHAAADIGALQALVGGGTQSPVYNCTATEQVGDAVYISAADNVRQASAVSAGTMPAVGIITSKPSATTCVVEYAGEISGLTGLTAGATYYVSVTTPGHLQGSAPNVQGQVVQPVGVARNPTTLVVNPQSMRQL